MVVEFRYDLPEVIYKKDLTQDISRRILQLEETPNIFWTLLKYEWE
jgi:hypothetical protein